MTCDGFHGVDYHDNYSNPGTPYSMCYSTPSYSTPSTPMLYNENVNTKDFNMDSNNSYNLNDSNDLNYSDNLKKLNLNNSNESSDINDFDRLNNENDLNYKINNKINKKIYMNPKYKKTPIDPIVKDCNICKGIIVVNYKHEDIPKLFTCNDLNENEFHGNDFHK